MKRLIVGLLALGLLSWAGVSYGAGSCSQRYFDLDNTGIMRAEFTCTADAAAATWPAITTQWQIVGLVFAAETNPGATAPTDNYDITVVNSNGIDIFGGALANRDTSTSERTMPILNSLYGAVPSDGQLTINITNNAVNSAIVVLTLYWFSG